MASRFFSFMLLIRNINIKWLFHLCVVVFFFHSFFFCSFVSFSPLHSFVSWFADTHIYRASGFCVVFLMPEIEYNQINDFIFLLHTSCSSVVVVVEEVFFLLFRNIVIMFHSLKFVRCVKCRWFVISYGYRISNFIECHNHCLELQVWHGST